MPVSEATFTNIDHMAKAPPGVSSAQGSGDPLWHVVKFSPSVLDVKLSETMTVEVGDGKLDVGSGTLEIKTEPLRIISDPLKVDFTVSPMKIEVEYKPMQIQMDMQLSRKDKLLLVGGFVALAVLQILGALIYKL